MGVGGILDFARIRFGNGLREWEVEQDDHGRFTFDGEELSFDMWAQMNQTGEDGVFRADVPIPPQRRRKPKMLYDYEGPSTNGTKKAEKRKKPPKEKDEGELSDSDDQHGSSSSVVQRLRRRGRCASAAEAKADGGALHLGGHGLHLQEGKTALLNSLRETPSL
ncbi:hypothetical protein M3Y99_00763700 [Aphelenchoides fujianensis]|nr:hypothetical protein M3Y99_00763700 [Aphelenchoides fujianensis]